MVRRDFLKTIGVAGVFSLLGSFPLYAAGEPDKTRNSNLKGPFDLAWAEGGELLVTDPSGYRVVRLDRSLKVVSSFGQAGSAPGAFNFPKGITVDSSGDIYVVDSNNCRVQVFSPAGAPKRVFGSIGSIGGSFAAPQGIFITDAGVVYVSDTRNHRIQVYKGSEPVAIFGELGDGPDRFRLPTACVCAANGESLVLDSKHGVVKVFDKEYRYKSSFGGVGKAPGLLNMPQGMAMDRSGNVWVADTGNHRVQKFAPDGRFLSAVEGVDKAKFVNPTGILCRENRIYVADNGNGRIQVIEAKA